MPKLSFATQGKGSAIVLLHGFPMNNVVWKNFTPLLAEHFKIITPDLPGFGNSPRLEESITIDSVADSIITFLKEEKIENPILVGHSLGGYVALAVAEKAPALLSGLVLFHSTARADSDEKKQSRNKTIDFIKKNGVKAFTSNFTQPLFANSSHPAIEVVKEISMEAEETAVIAYTQAMRDRLDKTAVLKTFGKPVLLIGGEKDGGIPPETLIQQATGDGISVKILPNVGHMGMFENPEITAALIADFAHGIRA
jgi:pimeloyl-ACP methyl ester carboxylesterase